MAAGTYHTQQRSHVRLWRRGARHLRGKSDGLGVPTGYSLHLVLKSLLLITNATVALARAGPLQFFHLQNGLGGQRDIHSVIS